MKKHEYKMKTFIFAFAMIRFLIPAANVQAASISTDAIDPGDTVTERDIIDWDDTSRLKEITYYDSEGKFLGTRDTWSQNSPYQIEAFTGIDGTTYSAWSVDQAGESLKDGSRWFVLKGKVPVQCKVDVKNGTNAIHQINSSKDMTFTCSSAKDNLKGIYVDGVLTDPSNYTLGSGNTIGTGVPKTGNVSNIASYLCVFFLSACIAGAFAIKRKRVNK